MPASKVIVAVAGSISSMPTIRSSESAISPSGARPAAQAGETSRGTTG